MGKVGYIYPQWSRAKSLLAEVIFVRIRNGKTSYGDIAEAVDDFFKHHIFEVGQEASVEAEYLSYLKKDKESFLEHQKRQVMMNIGQEIFKQGFYSEVKNENSFGKLTRQFKVLVFGAPEIVGLGTRESK